MSTHTLPHRQARQGRQDVVIGDQNAERAQASAAQIGERGGQAIAAGCDITDPAAVQALIDLARQHYGALDVLVNN